VEGLRSEWHRIGPKVPRIGNENFLSGFCLPLEISSFQWQRNGPTLAQWHSIDRLPLHPLPVFWANPVPLRKCPYNIKSQQWQAGSPKKLSTLPWRVLRRTLVQLGRPSLSIWPTASTPVARQTSTILLGRSQLLTLII